MRKETKGITLIALIITIIVMLILVMVSIQVLFNTGLFNATGKATQKWNEEQDKEANMQITIGNKTYGSVEEYIAGEKEEEWIPTDPKYFSYTVDATTKTATITGIKQEYRKISYYQFDAYTYCIQDGENIITDLVIPKTIDVGGINYVVTSIDDNAFCCPYDTGSTGWTSVKIPATVINIGYCAFRYSQKLAFVEIPDSVSLIDRYAFSFECYMDDLHVYYTGTAEQWSAISIGSGNSQLTSATIHYNSTMTGNT